MTEEKRQSLQQISKILCRAYNLLLEKKEVVFELQDVHTVGIMKDYKR